MARVVYIDNRLVSLDPSASIGIGGEAEVYKVSGGAFKWFKPSNHPDFFFPDGTPDTLQQEAARYRLEEHVHKLPDLMSLSLPDGVTKPIKLGTDGKQVVGYLMRLLSNVIPINALSERRRHDLGLDRNLIVAMFVNLHKLVSACHAAGFIIGDFNALNVLVNLPTPYVIDTDSAQFGRYFCRLYTETYVDPILCDPREDSPVLVGVYNEASDWYAFTCLLMSSLLCVGPYGGVYRPKDKSKRIPPGKRPLLGITIFDPEVIYPVDTIAFPYSILPDDLISLLISIFKRRSRDKFPESYLTSLRWTTCTSCGAVHARVKCPVCDKVAPGAIKQVITIRGNVKATRVFSTKGVIVFADYDNGLTYAYHENGQLLREGGVKVAPLDRLSPDYRFRIQTNATLVGARNKLMTFSRTGKVETTSVDTFMDLPVFDTSGDNTYWISSGVLQKSGEYGPVMMGSVLVNQTLFWVGPKLGFGFYRAEGVTIAFVFDTTSIGINDSVKVRIRGQLIDSTCFFSSSYCWFITQTQEAGKTINKCYVIKATGEIVATHETVAGDGSWLSTIRGKAATGDYLFVATDDGIVRVGVDNKKLAVDANFPDTQPFVDSNCHLFIGDGGIYVVNSKDVTLLQIG